MILVALSPIRTPAGDISPFTDRTDAFNDRIDALRGDADEAGVALMLREAEQYLEDRLASVGCVCDIRLTAGEDGTGTMVFQTATVIFDPVADPSALSEAARIIESQTGVQPVFREKGGTE